MNNKNKEKSLIECLKWCQVPALPDIDDKENIWIKAIALVKKGDGTESYVAMTKDKDLKNKMIKDFGTVSMIHEVVEVYPYSYLSAAYMPEFKTRKKEERINYLLAYDKKLEDLEELSLKELDKMVVNVAIKNQIFNEQKLK
jgi:hypothetical protein